MTTENDWQGYGTVQPYILVHDPIPIRTTACSRPFPYSFQIRYTQLQTDVGQSHTSRILNGCCPDGKLQFRSGYGYGYRKYFWPCMLNKYSKANFEVVMDALLPYQHF